MFADNRAKVDVMRVENGAKLKRKDRLYQMYSNCNKQDPMSVAHNDRSLQTSWGGFCSAVKSEDTMLSNWSRFAHNIRLFTQQTCDTLSSKPHGTILKQNFRLSLALVVRALEIKGVSADTISRTKCLLCIDIEKIKSKQLRRLHPVTYVGPPYPGPFRAPL